MIIFTWYSGVTFPRIEILYQDSYRKDRKDLILLFLFLRGLMTWGPFQNETISSSNL